MAWVRMKGIEGLVYVPETDPDAPRKHHCKDCICCRMCSDVCCSECLKHNCGKGKSKGKRKGGGSRPRS